MINLSENIDSHVQSVKIGVLVLILFLTAVPARGPQQARHTSYDLSRQMAQLRAATTTRIDAELSPANVTAITGETALLVCTVLNVGDKAVGDLHITLYTGFASPS